MKLRTFESFDHSDLKNTGDFEIFESNQAYHEWEDDVISHIEELCDCTRSDAQGIVMAQEYIMAQSWGDNMSAEQTAILIDRASLSEGVRQTIASDGIIIGHGSSKNKTAKEIKKLLAGIDVTLSFEDETKDGKPNMVIKYAQFDKAAKTSRGGLVGRKMKSVKSILGKLDASDKEVKIYSDWKPWRKKVNEDHSESEESYNDVITDGIHINADGRIRFQGKEVDNAGEFAEELDAYKRSSEANKKYFKISEAVNISPEFKTKLDAFLDHPWQEDKEIEFVELLSQNRRTMYGASEKQSRDYITRLAKQLTGAHLSVVSDKFMSDLTELENPETDI